MAEIINNPQMQSGPDPFLKKLQAVNSAMHAPAPIDLSSTYDKSMTNPWGYIFTEDPNELETSRALQQNGLTQLALGGLKIATDVPLGVAEARFGLPINLITSTESGINAMTLKAGWGNEEGANKFKNLSYWDTFKQGLFEDDLYDQTIGKVVDSVHSALEDNINVYRSQDYFNSKAGAVTTTSGLATDAWNVVSFIMQARKLGELTHNADLGKKLGDYIISTGKIKEGSRLLPFLSDGNKMNNYVAALWNTLYESGIEAKEANENIKKTLHDSYTESLLNGETPQYSADEIDSRAANAASEVGLMNMALLSVSNVWEQFVFKPSYSEAVNQYTKKMLANGITGAEQVASREARKAVLNIGKQVAVGIGMEGAYEEGLQQSLQAYERAYATNKTKDNLALGLGRKWLEGMGGASKIMFGDKSDLMGDEHEIGISMILGGLVGGVMGTYSGYNDFKNTKEQLSDAKDFYTHLINISKADDIHKEEVAGIFDVAEDGTRTLNKDKGIKYFHNIVDNNVESWLQEHALASGNETLYNIATKAANIKYAYRLFNNENYFEDPEVIDLLLNGLQNSETDNYYKANKEAIDKHLATFREAKAQHTSMEKLQNPHNNAYIKQLAYLKSMLNMVETIKPEEFETLSDEQKGKLREEIGFVTDQYKTRIAEFETKKAYDKFTDDLKFTYEAPIVEEALTPEDEATNYTSLERLAFLGNEVQELAAEKVIDLDKLSTRQKAKAKQEAKQAKKDKATNWVKSIWNKTIGKEKTELTDNKQDLVKDDSPTIKDDKGKEQKVTQTNEGITTTPKRVFNKQSSLGRVHRNTLPYKDKVDRVIGDSIKGQLKGLTAVIDKGESTTVAKAILEQLSKFEEAVVTVFVKNNVEANTNFIITDVINRLKTVKQQYLDYLNTLEDGVLYDDAVYAALQRFEDNVKQVLAEVEKLLPKIQDAVDQNLDEQNYLDLAENKAGEEAEKIAGTNEQAFNEAFNILKAKYASEFREAFENYLPNIEDAVEELKNSPSLAEAYKDMSIDIKSVRTLDNAVAKFVFAYFDEYLLAMQSNSLELDNNLILEISNKLEGVKKVTNERTDIKDSTKVRINKYLDEFSKIFEDFKKLHLQESGKRKAIQKFTKDNIIRAIARGLNIPPEELPTIQFAAAKYIKAINSGKVKNDEPAQSEHYLFNDLISEFSRTLFNKLGYNITDEKYRDLEKVKNIIAAKENPTDLEKIFLRTSLLTLQALQEGSKTINNAQKSFYLKDSLDALASLKGDLEFNKLVAEAELETEYNKLIDTYWNNHLAVIAQINPKIFKEYLVALDEQIQSDKGADVSLSPQQLLAELHILSRASEVMLNKDINIDLRNPEQRTSNKPYTAGQNFRVTTLLLNGLVGAGKTRLLNSIIKGLSASIDEDVYYNTGNPNANQVILDSSNKDILNTSDLIDNGSNSAKVKENRAKLSKSSGNVIIIDEVYLLDQANLTAIQELGKAGNLVILAGDPSQNIQQTTLTDSIFLLSKANTITVPALTATYRTSHPGITQAYKPFMLNIKEVKTVAALLNNPINEFTNTTKGSIAVTNVLDYLKNNGKKTDRTKLVLVDSEDKKKAYEEAIKSGSIQNTEVYLHTEAQGKEASEVFVDLEKGSFANIGEFNNAMYTALGRAKEFVAFSYPGAINSEPREVSEEVYTEEFAEMLDDYIKGVKAAINELSDVKSTPKERKEPPPAPEEAPIEEEETQEDENAETQEEQATEEENNTEETKEEPKKEEKKKKERNKKETSQPVVDSDKVIDTAIQQERIEAQEELDNTLNEHVEDEVLNSPISIVPLESALTVANPSNVYARLEESGTLFVGKRSTTVTIEGVPQDKDMITLYAKDAEKDFYHEVGVLKDSEAAKLGIDLDEVRKRSANTSTTIATSDFNGIDSGLPYNYNPYNVITDSRANNLTVEEQVDLWATDYNNQHPYEYVNASDITKSYFIVQNKTSKTIPYLRNKKGRTILQLSSGEDKIVKYVTNQDAFDKLLEDTPGLTAQEVLRNTNSRKYTKFRQFIKTKKLGDHYIEQGLQNYDEASPIFNPIQELSEFTNNLGLTMNQVRDIIQQISTNPDGQLDKNGEAVVAKYFKTKSVNITFSEAEQDVLLKQPSIKNSTDKTLTKSLRNKFSYLLTKLNEYGYNKAMPDTFEGLQKAFASLGITYGSYRENSNKNVFILKDNKQPISKDTLVLNDNYRDLKQAWKTLAFGNNTISGVATKTKNTKKDFTMPLPIIASGRLTTKALMWKLRNLAKTDDGVALMLAMAKSSLKDDFAQHKIRVDYYRQEALRQLLSYFIKTATLTEPNLEKLKALVEANKNASAVYNRDTVTFNESASANDIISVFENIYNLYNAEYIKYDPELNRLLFSQVPLEGYIGFEKGPKTKKQDDSKSFSTFKVLQTITPASMEAIRNIEEEVKKYSNDNRLDLDTVLGPLTGDEGAINRSVLKQHNKIKSNDSVATAEDSSDSNEPISFADFNDNTAEDLQSVIKNIMVRAQFPSLSIGKNSSTVVTLPKINSIMNAASLVSAISNFSTDIYNAINEAIKHC